MTAHLAEHIVDEREQRRDRTKTPRDRSPAARGRPQRRDEATRFMEERELGVKEPVDRLLAIADDEDRRLRDQSCALTPRLDEQRDELPLLTARCPELVEDAEGVAPLRA